MINLNNILVSHDFSDCSAQALDFGVELALETGASLHFLHVEIFHEDHFLNTPSPNSKAEQLREKLKTDIYASVKKQGFEPADIPGIQYSVVSDYSAPNGINQYSLENQIDLIVMGTHGRRGMAMHMKRAEGMRGDGLYTLGSVAETVVRTAPCSVFTIREKIDVDPLESYLKKIIVPINFSNDAATDTTNYTGATNALGFAKNMAAFYEVKIELVHVIEEWEAPPYYDANDVLIYESSKVTDFVLEKMKDIAENTGGAEVDVEFVVLKGDPANEINRHVQSSQKAMVVMAANAVASHWQDGIGSTIERVVRLANCPVLTVKGQRTLVSKT